MRVARGEEGEEGRARRSSGQPSPCLSDGVELGLRKLAGSRLASTHVRFPVSVALSDPFSSPQLLRSSSSSSPLLSHTALLFRSTPNLATQATDSSSSWSPGVWSENLNSRSSVVGGRERGEEDKRWPEGEGEVGEGGLGDGASATLTPDPPRPPLRFAAKVHRSQLIISCKGANPAP